MARTYRALVPVGWGLSLKTLSILYQLAVGCWLSSASTKLNSPEDKMLRDTSGPTVKVLQPSDWLHKRAFNKLPKACLRVEFFNLKCFMKYFECQRAHIQR